MARRYSNIPPSNTEEYKGLVRDRNILTIDPNGNLWKLNFNGDRLFWQNVTKIQSRAPYPRKGSIEGWEKEGLVPWTQANADSLAADDAYFNKKTTVGPFGGELPDDGGEGGKTLRWPEDALESSTDYVFFQFGKYIPPFSRDAGYREIIDKETTDINDIKTKVDSTLRTATTETLYNSNTNNLDVTKSAKNIMLPIPQDLSNEIQQVWQGKQFTAVGRAAIAAVAGGNLSYAKSVVGNITGNAKAIQTALTTFALNSIPGVGGNIEFNDVSGSTRGIVINPNAELLYDSPEMREIGMIFRLVPRNETEAKIIRNIVRTFRQAAMPSWGAYGTEPMVRGPASSAQEQDEDLVSFGGEDNWIRVPNLCKFTFMKGGEPHPYLIQFKPCAISRVEVNYTSDGTYATYTDGSPVVTELSLNFMETKLIFADEVSKGF
tara:strand:- start:1053 stop:2354 length:1302 start_codon:yes stop_codon:yes gene_type:complete